MAAIGFWCDLWWPHTDFVVLFFILSELVPFSKINIRFSAQLISIQYYEVFNVIFPYRQFRQSLRLIIDSTGLQYD